MQTSLKTKLATLELKNPVLVASGTYGYGEEFAELYDISKLGAVVTKGISLKPRNGNPMPRVIETASGMLNAIGLANVGLDAFLHEKLPFLKKAKATVIVNIFGECIEDYVALALKLNGTNGISGLELNISCPNVKSGGLSFGTNPKSAAQVTQAVRKVTSFPLIVKLSPQVASITEIATAVVEAGADILALINTVPGIAIDAKSRKPKLANIIGGLSGPAIKPIALKQIYEVYKAVKAPIIGMGGIMNTTDAIEFFLAGARAIQIGTGNFINPSLALEIVYGLRQYMIDHNLSDLDQIIGKLES